MQLLREYDHCRHSMRPKAHSADLIRISGLFFAGQECKSVDYNRITCYHRNVRPETQHGRAR
jgi:hypothetical protein